MNATFCIGCGCHDERACPGGCAWLRVDQIAEVGVCSECPGHVERFDAGDRTLSDEATYAIEDAAAAQGFGLVLPEEFQESEEDGPFSDTHQLRLILPGDPGFHL